MKFGRIGEGRDLVLAEIAPQLVRILVEKLDRSRQRRLERARAGRRGRDHVAAILEMQTAPQIQHDPRFLVQVDELRLVDAAVREAVAEASPARTDEAEIETEQARSQILDHFLPAGEGEAPDKTSSPIPARSIDTQQ